MDNVIGIADVMLDTETRTLGLRLRLADGSVIGCRWHLDELRDHMTLISSQRLSTGARLQ
jgi:hypothetical protein